MSLSVSIVFSRSAYQTTPAVLKRFCGYVAWVLAHTHTPHTVIALIISCFLFALEDFGPSPENLIGWGKDKRERKNEKQKDCNAKGEEKKEICWLRTMIILFFSFVIVGWHHVEIVSTLFFSPFFSFSICMSSKSHRATRFFPQYPTFSSPLLLFCYSAPSEWCQNRIVSP